MKYRDHTGSLEESMKTVQEVESIQDIVHHLNKSLEKFDWEVEEIKFVKSMYDTRINWDTYNVTYRITDHIEFWVAGQSDGKFEDWKK